MANILLIDGDGMLATELADNLGPWHHNLTTCSSAPVAIAELTARNFNYDLIALNMSRNRPEDWKSLDQMREFVQLTDAVPRIVCFSTAYWGPQMQLTIERRGCRLVYL